MSDICRYEHEMVAAAESGQWTDELREHARTCADCAAAVSVSAWMDLLGRTDERQHKLPDPSVVWLKSQILRGSMVVERASRPITLLQIISYVGVAGAWAAFLSVKWASIQRWITGWSPQDIASHAAAGPVSLSVLAAFFVLSSITVMLALHTILAEE